MTKPVIAVTIGDPAGIGAEIALKALAETGVRDACRPFLIGDARIVAFYAERCGINAALNRISGPAEAAFAPGSVDILHLETVDPEGFTPGEARADCGRAILEYAAKAVGLALSGDIAAIVAGPQTQKAIRAAGIEFDGYPRYIAERTGTDPDDVFLMLYNDDFRIVHTTLHLGLRDALDRIDTPRILRALRAADRTVRNLGVADPRIAVAGINPHAGEDSLFGTEDEAIVKPAVAAARAEGIGAEGPFGADTMFLDRSYDAYLVMYHDQGHIPAKLLGFDATAAFTIGTPVFFTTVAHGSAADIAGKGVADPSALIRTIVRMSNAGRD
jgi:4-hydroxythreonine-4-phosphate dehydrogenase